MKVLVTGATGFIGSHLIPRLIDAGYEIRALVRKANVPDFLKGDKIELWLGDLTHAESLKDIAQGIEVVCHLAGVLGASEVEESYYQDLNVKGTANLINESKKYSIKKFIHCSTAGVLGIINDGVGNEASPYNPNNIYEQTKAAGEKLVLDAIKKDKLPAIILRPGLVYGPGDMHHLGLFKAIKNHYFFLIDKGQSYLDPVFVEDLAQAFIQVIEIPDKNGEIYMISGASSVKVIELAQSIAASLGRSKRFLSMPKDMAIALAKLFELFGRITAKRVLLTKSRVKFLSENRISSSLKAQNELGFNPISLEQGIMKTVNWYKEQGYL